MALFKIVEENPNEVTGGGGCLCSEDACKDTAGPFVVFFGTSEMDSSLSPVPVMCAGCVDEAHRQLHPRVEPGPLVGHPTGRPEPVPSSEELPEL